MKFRQAKKIIVRELEKAVKHEPNYYGWLDGPLRWRKALRVYYRHIRKNHKLNWKPRY